MKTRKYSIYFITMLMALGLGNIWRFPYLIHDYGAGAFLIMYALLSLFIGVPLIVAEVLLGKAHHGREYGSSGRILKNVFFDRKIKGLKWLPVFVTYVVLSYYSIISGWLLHYVCQILYCIISGKPFIAENAFLQLMTRPWLQVLLTSVHLVLMFLFMNKGERIKINRLTALVLPCFFIFIFYLIYNYYNTDEMLQTAKLLLYPNFNQLNKASLNFAMGQMLFTLSLGFGTLISFGKSLREDASVTSIASRLGGMDSVTSIIVAFVIFPMVVSLGYIGSGSEILFSVIPYYLHSLGLGQGYTFLFYFLTYFVSLAVALGLIESISMNIFESKDFSKARSIVIACNLVFVLAVVIIFSDHITAIPENMGYRNMVVLVDDVLINFILPISVILISFSAYKFLDRKFVEKEFIRDEGPSTWRFFLYWRFVIMYGFPVLYLISLLIRFS